MSEPESEPKEHPSIVSASSPYLGFLPLLLSTMDVTWTLKMGQLFPSPQVASAECFSQHQNEPRSEDENTNHIFKVVSPGIIYTLIQAKI